MGDLILITSALSISENQPVGSVVGKIQTSLILAFQSIIRFLLRLIKIIGWWAFDETSGTTAYDSSGNSQHASLKNGAGRHSNGVMGGALSLDGSNDYVLTPLDGPHNMNLSWSLWIKTFDYNGGLVAANSGSWYDTDKAFYLVNGKPKFDVANVGNKSTSQFVSSGMESSGFNHY